MRATSDLFTIPSGIRNYRENLRARYIASRLLRGQGGTGVVAPKRTHAPSARRRRHELGDAIGSPIVVRFPQPPYGTSMPQSGRRPQHHSRPRSVRFDRRLLQKADIERTANSGRCAGVLGTKIRWDYLGTAGSFGLVTGKSVSLVAEIHSCAIGCGGLVGRIEASQDTARMCAHNGWEATSRV